MGNISIFSKLITILCCFHTSFFSTANFRTCNTGWRFTTNSFASHSWFGLLTRRIGNDSILRGTLDTNDWTSCPKLTVYP